jgi:aryl-alcohol dehydrogenase-like predicted oxidoreductase
MKTTQLGPLRVSRIALGAMLMGDTTRLADAHRVLDRYLEAVERKLPGG